MLPERPLPGIDYCEHTVLAATGGALPSWETIRACPICARCWRIAEARHGGWPPLPREEALTLFGPLATALVADGGDRANETERRFYAYLAIAPDDEADFAAAVAAARGDTAEEVPSPRDFRWRDLFADLGQEAQARSGAALTRVWQWRTLDTTLAAEGRSFVAGEMMPPFHQPPPGTMRAGRWLREGAGRSAPLLQQILGPLLLTLTAGNDEAVIVLTLRLRDHAMGEELPTRIYLGDGEDRRTGWHGTLSEGAQEHTLQFSRDELATFTIEIDTAW